ncbi:MAG: hypothetical protein ACRC2H_06440 [Silanimonas sp.]
MPEFRSVLSFARGPFQPHGDITYWTEDRLLRYIAQGPFNEEAFVALAEASRQLHEAMPFQKPFAHLTEVRGSALATPGAMATFEAFLVAMARRGNNGVAVAMVIAPEVEGRLLMLPRFEKAYEKLGLPYRCFETVAEANVWLSPLLRVAGPAQA